jgi:hypothetical protein
MFEYTYSRSVVMSEYNIWDLDVLISKLVEVALPGKQFKALFVGTTAKFQFEVELSSAEETDLDTVVVDFRPAGNLSWAKGLKYEKIETKTKELLGEGFEFPSESGQRFSFSLEEQSQWHAFIRLKDDPTFTYPVDWSFIDNSGYYAIPNSATLEEMYMTGVGTYRAVVDSGTALKNQVRDATTYAELALVEDNR